VPLLRAGETQVQVLGTVVGVEVAEVDAEIMETHLGADGDLGAGVALCMSGGRERDGAQSGERAECDLVHPVFPCFTGR
jgi:hypothetical protein